MKKAKKLNAFSLEAVAILEDALRGIAESLREWWEYRSLIAKERNSLRRMDADNIPGEYDVYAHLNWMEIARYEHLCKKYDVFYPKQQVSRKAGVFSVVDEHWFSNDEKRRDVLRRLDEARSSRQKEQRGWLLAATGVIGAVTGLAAVLLK